MILIMKKEQLRQEFTARLIEAMDDLKIPKRKRTSTLAEWMGKSQKNPEFARKWLNGMSKPQDDNLAVLVSKLGVRHEWLDHGIPPKLQGQPPSKELSAIIEYCQSLTPEEQKRALDLLRDRAKIKRKKAEKKKD